MGSISSSLSSTTVGNQTVTATTYFNGMSSDAQSLNSQISRQVQMASLPIELLQNDVTNLTSQSNELQSLNTDMASVQSAISGIASAAGDMMSASISDSSVASPTIGSNATAGTYSLAVTNLGSYSEAVSGASLPKVTDPTTQSISTSSSFTLTVNGETIQPPIQPSGASLDALAQAITASNAGVQATVINVGSNTVPDYRLSLQSDQYGSVTMQLNDGSDLLQQSSSDLGQPVQYSINGQAVTSGSRTVTLALGLTANLTGVSQNGPSTVTVAPDSSSIGNALQSLVTAYNKAIADLGTNRGQSGGALTGQSIVSGLTNSLQSLATYTVGSGSISSLAALGLTFADASGQLSFNQNTFDSATSGQTAALQQFLGSANGGGFLGTATTALANIEDAGSGMLTQDISHTQSQITSINTQIAAQQAQVAQLQQNLIKQMAAADAMIYSLQQQSSYFQQMFAAQNSNKNAGL